MAKKTIGISVDGICDLPYGMASERGLELINFIIETENGRFRDREEMTGENVFEHMSSGGFKAEAYPPTVNDYRLFFADKLKKYKKIVHISASSGIFKAYDNALQAARQMGQYEKSIFILDSQNISSSLGMIALKGADMAKNKSSVKEILFELDLMKNRVSTSFLLYDALYLYLNDVVKLKTVKICEFLRIHPVITIKDGKIRFSRVMFGAYPACTRRFVKNCLKGSDRIDKKMLFAVNSMSNFGVVRDIKEAVENIGDFKSVIATKASGTISSFWGQNMLGIMFTRK